MDRVTHKHVNQAIARYHDRLMLDYPAKGYLQWADIRGDGSNRRNLYVVINDNGGVCQSHLRGKTMRETIANIDFALLLDGLPDYAVIIRAIHESGTKQVSALAELDRRGLWLSDEQKRQAGLRLSKGRESVT